MNQSFISLNEVQSQINHETELLLCCSRTSVDDETQNKIRSLVLLDLDWDYLQKIAMWHKVTALLYLNLHSICPELVPDYFLLKLKRKFNINAQKNLFILRELINVSQIFNENEITAINYKGVTLSASAYGGPEFREFADIDIFIKKKDYWIAKKTLEAINYMPQYHLDLKQEKLHQKYMHELKFINSKNSLSVELQWQFSGRCSHFPKRINKYIQEIKLESVSINNNKVLTFSPEDLIIILCIHAAGHLWRRLLWICDINEHIQANDSLDWGTILVNSNKLGIEKVVYVSILLSMDLFGTKLPEEIKSRIKSDRNAKEISILVKKNIFQGYGNKSSIIEDVILRKKIRENTIYGIKDALAPLFTPSPEEWKIISLPPYLSSIYYFVRIFRLLNKYKFDLFRLKK